MNRPVLVLDVDGVLNSAQWWRAAKPKSVYTLDPVAVTRVLGLIERTKADVVLSSTWREYPDGVDVLQAAGFKFIDFTPLEEFTLSGTRHRGRSIRTWLDMNHVTTFAIVDDDRDAGMGVGLTPHFVQTSWEHGIQDKHIKRLEALLR